MQDPVRKHKAYEAKDQYIQICIFERTQTPRIGEETGGIKYGTRDQFRNCCNN